MLPIWSVSPGTASPWADSNDSLPAPVLDDRQQRDGPVADLHLDRESFSRFAVIDAQRHQLTLCWAIAAWAGPSCPQSTTLSSKSMK